ncbi:hypothetical protein D082_34140 [Synechocystis sp. PCC 6714]|nr:hypothetical protein D082_34140 [Synechocystis sp. PCC 6714]
MYLGLSDYFKPSHNIQGNHTKKDTKFYISPALPSFLLSRRRSPLGLTAEKQNQ